MYVSIEMYIITSVCTSFSVLVAVGLSIGFAFLSLSLSLYIYIYIYMCVCVCVCVCVCIRSLLKKEFSLTKSKGSEVNISDVATHYHFL